MTRTLTRRADVLRAAEVGRWRAAWEAFLSDRWRPVPTDAVQAWADVENSFDGMEESEADAYDARLKSVFEALKATWHARDEAEGTACDPELRARWEAWWEAWRIPYDLDAPDLALWPSSVPEPPPLPPGEMEDRQRLLADFRAAEEGSDRRAVLAYLVCSSGWVDAARALHDC